MASTPRPEVSRHCRKGLDPRAKAVIRLWFGGATRAEIATALGVSPVTVSRITASREGRELLRRMDEEVMKDVTRLAAVRVVNAHTTRY